MNSSGWKSFLRDPQLPSVWTHTKNSQPNLRHLFSIPLSYHRSTSLLSQSDLFSVFSSPFYPSVHPTNPPSIPVSLIPSLSVWVGPSVLLIKSNEVIYHKLPFSQRCSINHSQSKRLFHFLPLSAARTMTRLEFCDRESVAPLHKKAACFEWLFCVWHQRDPYSPLWWDALTSTQSQRLETDSYCKWASLVSEDIVNMSVRWFLLPRRNLIRLHIYKINFHYVTSWLRPSRGGFMLSQYTSWFCPGSV